jgi:flagellar basal body-associated protein FliL
VWAYKWSLNNGTLLLLLLVVVVVVVVVAAAAAVAAASLKCSVARLEAPKVLPCAYCIHLIY